MAHIVEVKEIPLDDLVIGKGQSRLSQVGKDISELAESIRKVGLLEPIVVCPAEKPGKFEIITGQRRFLAHRELKKNTILAAVLSEKVDEMTAKVLSLTENLIRLDLNRKDKIDACTYLYKKYGSVEIVCEETALPPREVREYIKYDRLKPELRNLVDKGQADIKAALRAQDAASIGGKYSPDEAIKLAKEMASMSGVQQVRIVKERERKPTLPVDEIIESAKTGAKVTQIVVTLGAAAHQALQTYAREEDSTLDDAARTLIEEGLAAKGYAEE